MKKIQSAERLDKFTYAIRDIVAVASEFEKNGDKITYLSIGDPPKYDFDTPYHIKNALNQAILDGRNLYVDSEGINELREEIAKHESKNHGKITIEDVLITSGVSEAIYFIYGSLLNPKDELLVPGPSYPPFISYANFFGAEPIEYQMDENDDWQPNIDDLRAKITEKTKSIVIITPNNPVGTVYSEKTLNEIKNIAGEHGIPIICDNIYEQIVYDEKTPGIKTTDVPIINLSGFSKAYLMTGWRLGYIFYADPLNLLENFRQSVIKLARARLCANGPSQYAALAALRGPQDHVKEMINKLKKRRDLIHSRLSDIPGITCQKPRGAFYIFPKVDLGNKWTSDKEFVIDLLKKKKILVVHGSGFGEKYGTGHFRLVFLAPENVLEHSADEIEDFMRKSK
ncbi:MAG: aminotransferase class I/II-fold pyridoxal phosphate-dependent enzyme [Candidatus Lokiarchaeota archaeon]|nr:aminotransferase class I/II-fold pyridoxal phosphate-dependent enzyme [Candidatus Lokiarchaeota archaeon]